MTDFNDQAFYEGDVLLFRDHVAKPYLEQRAEAEARSAHRAELDAVSRQHARIPPEPRVKCRVLLAVFQHRERDGAALCIPKVGDLIALPRSDAQWMAAAGRVEILD